MDEALVMADFKHPNILGLTGVCIKYDTEVPIIVLPFMEHGDLQKYLRHFRYERDQIHMAPDFLHLLSFCLQVARGLSYLAERRCVHRDLAARNCMLNSDMVVKVADFGLARDIYCAGYYRQNKQNALPWKWMAIESMQDRVFTTNSDIWSYGVTVWEILTLGKTPYPVLPNSELMDFLKNGGRLPKPEICSDGLFQLLLQCWSETPTSRPPFLDIVKHLEDTMSDMAGYLDMGIVGAPQGTTRPPVRTSKPVCLNLESTRPKQDTMSDMTGYLDMGIVGAPQGTARPPVRTSKPVCLNLERTRPKQDSMSDMAGYLVPQTTQKTFME